ncbi:FimB/Mfa2 family fimbrial subunit [uncultured Parabacteroides sp.]|jgi:hypothetical protein|uniref:FimB/Mfa2 family fimbrial subunit n=1 Tax=uncultured Parabacteroides sp. TaxID=512312 RepID=UPI0025CFA556|nr:FimB/Mfa2 family fimbrial subunit [uncultured Parabacteroides sp.]
MSKMLQQMLFIISLFILSSCVKENEDCRTFITFVYDKHMQSGDLFVEKVSEVTLYVFDEGGKYLKTITANKNSLIDGSTVELGLPKYKTYTFLAWCGANSTYRVSDLKVGETRYEEVELQLSGSRDKIQGFSAKLDELYHGILENVLLESDEKKHVLFLTKNTNKIRFVLQQYNAETRADGFHLGDYTFELLSANGTLDHLNERAGADIINYTPYDSAGIHSGGWVEINTNRLFANEDFRFVVTRRKDSKKVFDISLRDYVLLTNMEGNDWSAQEYLDRQDRYLIVFFYSSLENGWSASQIVINDWVVYKSNEEL